VGGYTNIDKDRKGYNRMLSTFSHVLPSIIEGVKNTTNTDSNDHTYLLDAVHEELTRVSGYSAWWKWGEWMEMGRRDGNGWKCMTGWKWFNGWKYPGDPVDPGHPANAGDAADADLRDGPCVRT
jgi:hypothetical protein